MDCACKNKVTHLCGAPIIMSLITGSDEKVRYNLDHEVEFFTAAAPPPQKVLSDMKRAGFNVTHLYGLTEVYGPAVLMNGMNSGMISHWLIKRR